MNFDEEFHRAACQREVWCAPLHRQLAHLHSLQLTRVTIGPGGVEVETVWTPGAARVRDQLLEIIDWYTREAFKDLMYQPAAEDPPEYPRPTLGSLRGMAPDCTGGMDSVAYVRKLRDEDWDGPASVQ